MQIKNLLLSSALLSSTLFAGGDITPVEPVVEEITAETNTWSFELEPYLMLTNIEGDSKFGNVPTTELDVDFGTILDNLEMAAMVHFEAHHQSGWGLWIDYGFMKLANDIEPIDRISSVQVRQGVLEAFGMYRQGLSSGYIDYLAGIRWWDNDYDINYTLPLLGRTDTLSKEVDWVDAVVGARYTHILNENWKFRVHGDIGGGGADFTVSTSAGVIYTINDLLDVDLKYKATWVDYEEGTAGQRDHFVYNTVTHGLIVGLNFKF